MQTLTPWGLGMAWVDQPISKLGRFLTKYVPNSMPIFEKKCHLKRRLECLKLWVLHKKQLFMLYSKFQTFHRKFQMRFFFENWHSVRDIFCKEPPQLWNWLVHPCHAQTSGSEGLHIFADFLAPSKILFLENFTVIFY